MLAPSPRAAGLEYFDLYGLLSFRCDPLRASLQPHQCADRWRKAERGSSCHGCKIGAIHAGQPEALPPPKNGCCRCGRTDLRLLSKTTCISCYNRQREVIKGRNGKGLLPVQAGAVLRWAFAILDVQNAAAALNKLMERQHSSGPSGSTGRRPNYLPGLPMPEAEALDASHLWLSVIVSGQEELVSIVGRLLPGAVILESEFSVTFEERWRAEAA